MPALPIVVAVVCAVLAGCGTIYFLLSIWAAKRFQSENSGGSDKSFTPPVSILKSLKGLDAHMYAAFRSHCLLDYPEYEVLFGVSDPGDPALALVEKLREEFPERQVQVVHCPQSLGSNGKVSNLAQLLPHAHYEHIVINDSDIVVERDYLQGVMAPFRDPAVGMATTLYRGVAGKTLGSKLEALGLMDFAGGVLLARVLEGGIHFALGATIATTKTVLRQIGGLESVLDFLADDYELGARAAAAGNRIELANVVVETALPDYSFRDFWIHQIRWARTVKDRRPLPYFGMVVTCGLAWSILAVLLAPRAWWSWLILAAVGVARLSSALVISRGVLRVPRATRDLWLLPLRDLVALATWTASYCGNRIEWRGLEFRLREGKLERM